MHRKKNSKMISNEIQAISCPHLVPSSSACTAVALKAHTVYTVALAQSGRAQHNSSLQDLPILLEVLFVKREDTLPLCSLSQIRSISKHVRFSLCLCSSTEIGTDSCCTQKDWFAAAVKQQVIKIT